jgi:hypothetical protein
MLTFEVAFLGWRFSLARTLISIPVFVTLAVAMERLLPGDFCPPALEEPSHGGDGRGPSSLEEGNF